MTRKFILCGWCILSLCLLISPATYAQGVQFTFTTGDRPPTEFQVVPENQLATPSRAPRWNRQQPDRVRSTTDDLYPMDDLRLEIPADATPGSEIPAGLRHLSHPSAGQVAVPRDKPSKRASLTTVLEGRKQTTAARPPKKPGKPGKPGENSTDPAGEEPTEESGETASEEPDWAKTPEGRSIQEIYQDIFKRSVDSSGLATYSRMMREEGKTIEDIKRYLYNSLEYRNRFGTDVPADYVDPAAQEELRRQEEETDKPAQPAE